MMRKGRVWAALTATIVISLTGCASSPSQEGGENGATVASTITENLITRIEAMDAGVGTRIAVYTAGQLPYQLFPLHNPDRLLFTFAGTRLDPTIQPRNLDLATITGIYPVEEANGASKVEVMLRGNLEYEVTDRADGFDLVVKRPAEAKATSGTVLRDIHVAKDENGTTISLVGPEGAGTPQIFRLNDPPRVVVDMFGVGSALEKNLVPVNSSEVTNITVGSGPEKTRLVMDLTIPQVTYRLENHHGQPVVVLSQGSQGSGSNNLTAVDFTRDGPGAAVTVQLDRTDVLVDAKHEGNDVILELKGITPRPELIRRMDVSAFGGPVTAIDTYRDNENSKIILRLNSPNARHKVMQKGKELRVSILNEADAPKDSDAAVYKGEKITFDFKDIDVQNALKLIAEIGNLNIITSDSVSGTITMRLIDVPWDQAFQLILDSRGLGSFQDGNVYRIAPLAELQSASDAKLKAELSKAQLEPLITEMIPVSFADVNSLSTLLKEGDSKTNSRLLSPRGSVSVDERTNTLIVKDTASNMTAIREMVIRLDKPISQVLIEARIVEVSRSDASDIGISWGFNFFHETGDNYYGFSDSINGVEEFVNKNTIDPNVDLMDTDPNFGLQLGSLDPFFNLAIEIGALESVGKAKTISSPRVLTVNNQQAEIIQGVSHPYATQAEGGGTTYEYNEAVLMLQVTPQITPDGHVTLDVYATNDSLGSAPAGAPPPINQKQIKTKVLVKNGETVVLGGIFQNVTVDDETGIPGLSQVPLLNWLFKSQSLDNTQSELLIFITPRIVDAK